jgi:threonine aldolase
MIDLRSDTVTQPTQAMLEAMRQASLGDDSRDGDPCVRSLEARAAQMTGKQAAVFMPSGTMTNLVAILTHTEQQGEILLEADSHILNNESAGLARLAGALARPLPGKNGAMGLSALEHALKRNHWGRRLISMETTHNSAGGQVLSLAHMQAVYALAQQHDVAVHTDGARLFNAAVFLNCQASDICAFTDSVTFCLSKGLSAPIGSVLCGSVEFCNKARLYRRMVGGHLRQAGPLAAAGLLALETMVARLHEDHRHASHLGEQLHRLHHLFCNPVDIHTNIVMVDVSHSTVSAQHWVRELLKHNVAAGAWSDQNLRLVTHRHISTHDIENTITAFEQVWNDVKNQTLK